MNREEREGPKSESYLWHEEEGYRAEAERRVEAEARDLEINRGYYRDVLQKVPTLMIVNELKRRGEL
jgi:hypothetical protein